MSTQNLIQWLQRGRRETLKQLRTRMTMLDGESANVIKLVRTGALAADDPQIAAELGNIAAQKRALGVDIETLERQLEDGERAITPEILDKFGSLVAGKLRDPDEQARRDYIRRLVDRVEVGDREVRISGNKTALSSIAMGTPPHMVPNSERKWCATQSGANQSPRYFSR